MRPFLPRLLASLILGVLLVGPAHAKDDPAKSPEDVLKSFASAMKKEDVKAAMSHLTPDSQSFLAGHTLGWAMLSRNYSERYPVLDPKDDPKKGKERIAAIEQALKRHGMSYDATRMPDVNEIFLETESSWKKFTALGEPIKDKPAFIADFLKINTRLDGPSVFKLVGDAKIKSVTVDEKTARGRVTKPIHVSSEDDMRMLSIGECAILAALDRCDTFYFQLQDGEWKIDLFETWRNIPRQPSSPPAKPATPPAATYCVPQPVLVRRCCCCCFRLFGRW